MRGFWVGLLMLWLAPDATACEWSEFAQVLLADEDVAAVGHPVRLMFHMAEDADLADRVISRARADHRCQTRRLLEALRLSEPAAVELVPDIHVVYDLGPGPGERPPTWADVRREGLLLLEAVALDPAVARDQRLARALAKAREHRRAHKPGEIAGRVQLWAEWWTDRGDDVALMEDPSLLPDVSDWVQGLAAPLAHPSALRVENLLRDMVDDRLRRRLLLERLNVDQHEGVVAECIHWLTLYQPQYEERGFAPPQWNPQTGVRGGYRAEDLREASLDILARVTDHAASGQNHDTVVEAWMYWWRSARFQARYYRDLTNVPSLAPWFALLESPEEAAPDEFAELLRQWYVAEGFREMLMAQLGAAHRSVVGDLMEWVTRTEADAIALGFRPTHNRRPVRPLLHPRAQTVHIAWSRVQAMIRDMLRAVTAELGPTDLGYADLEETMWADWWRQQRFEARWYRASQAPPASARPQFKPERAPRSG